MTLFRSIQSTHTVLFKTARTTLELWHIDQRIVPSVRQA